ncbi:MAG: hypothetical protein CM1200mP35_02960 [Chloroflexota bacterium]|nr:MAG: hypothetical protein CM1200mP35_02960 [Chloroflexota bacterium]
MLDILTVTYQSIARQYGPPVRNTRIKINHYCKTQYVFEIVLEIVLDTQFVGGNYLVYLCPTGIRTNNA